MWPPPEAVIYTIFNEPRRKEKIKVILKKKN